MPDAHIELVSASFRLGDSGSSDHTMLRQLLGTMSDIRNAVANLVAHVLILWGDRDCFNPPLSCADWSSEGSASAADLQLCIDLGETCEALAVKGRLPNR